MKKIIIGGAAIIASSVALAESPFTVELLTGKRTLDSDLRDTSTGIRGGYKFSKNIIFEAMYSDYGSFSIEDNDSTKEYNSNGDFSTLTFGVKSGYFLTDNFSVNGRIGLQLIKNDTVSVETDIVGVTRTTERTTVSDTTSSLYYGVGLNYKINEQFFTGIEYSLSTVRFEGDDEDNDFKNIALSIGYNL